MLTSPNSDGSLGLSDAFVEAAQHLADRHGALVGNYLRFIFPDHSARTLPGALLLELGALLQIQMWERSGISSHLGEKLPSYRDAADEFVRRCRLGSADFFRPNATPLLQIVFRVFMEFFAWDGPEFLDADLVIDHQDEDEFTNLLAEFIWTHRHELEYLTEHNNNEES